MSWHIKLTNYNSLTDPMQSLSKGMGFRQVAYFEKTTALLFADTQAHVHVETGALKASGIVRTHFDGSEWSGEIEYDAHPGIFELARGDTPTRTHPTGGHFFFDGAKDFIPTYEDNVDAVFRDAFNMNAPI